MKSDYPTATILGSHTRRLRSDIVDDEYELSIWLPPSYATSEKTYPILCVLDSSMTFGSAALGALLQSWGVNNVPEMIVVGIGKRISSLEEWWPVRQRDYAPIVLPSDSASGHAANYLNSLLSKS